MKTELAGLHVPYLWLGFPWPRSELVTSVRGQGGPAWRVYVPTLGETGVTVGHLRPASLGLFKEAPRRLP